MGLEEFETIDCLRGTGEKIVIRLDGEDLVELPCSVRYDAALSGGKVFRVRVPRKIEVLEDGSWKPYPTVCWLDGTEHEDQLMTRVLAKITGEDGFDFMASPDGVPDGALMLSAKEAGVLTLCV